MKPQRGFVLLEAVAVVAIVLLCAAAMLASISAAAKLSATSARNRNAAALLAAQTLRVAENAWKYGSPGEAPSGTAPASMPIPGSGTAVPVTVSSTITSQTDDGAAITVTIAYPPGDDADPGELSLAGALRVKAPLPGAQLERPGLIAQPAGH